MCAFASDSNLGLSAKQPRQFLATNLTTLTSVSSCARSVAKWSTLVIGVIKGNPATSAAGSAANRTVARRRLLLQLLPLLLLLPPLITLLLLLPSLLLLLNLLLVLVLVLVLLLLLLLLLCHPQARQSGCVSKLPAARATSQVATPNMDSEICLDCSTLRKRQG